jgi:hypothetical protein
MTRDRQPETIHTVTAETAFGMGNGSMADGRHEEVSESRPETSVACFNMGNACRGENRLEEAIVCYQRAVSLQPVSEWRWGPTDEDTPWYPTMRLFRQSRHGDWAGVLARVCPEVRSLLSKGPRIR